MRRTVGALGLLGLVCAVALPAASAATLWQPDLTKDTLEAPAGSTIYRQGIGSALLADPTLTGVGVQPFLIFTDKAADDTRRLGWLVSGNSDGIAESPGDDTSTDPAVRTVPFMMLTGDPKWADVSFQCRMDSYDMNTWGISMVLRATPKTKDTDPDTRYELRYQSDVGTLLASEIRDNIPANDTDTSLRQDGSTVTPISLRLMKVVNGKWTLLAKQDAATSKVYVPLINAGGVDHDTNKSPDGDAGDEALTGGYFRFVAKGDLLQAFVSLDGKVFNKVLEAHDSDIKAGQVGFMHYDAGAVFKEILVEDAP